MGDNNTEELIAATSVSIQTNVSSFGDSFNNYISLLGLPTENVLISNDERMVVINNLPYVVKKLNSEYKSDAMYISKFIAACGAGLFDAALNFLWNETIVNLRQKVNRYDINYFLDSIITETKRRASFKVPEDLKKLDDWELIRGCKDTGIITEIGYKHLDYVREMRNYASAAHPNQNNLDGLQISSWLQTCIKEVLAKEPEGPVIEIKKLIFNIRHNILTIDDIPPITGNIQLLQLEIIDSFLSAIFGMYTDIDLDVNAKNNLKLIVPSVWENSSKQEKHNTALKYAIFSANAEIDRKNLAHEFLTLVNGLSFLPNDQKILDMNQILESLNDAHYGWNNFQNEISYAKSLHSYIPKTGEVPETILEKYVKIVVTCRIGNRYGVSDGAYEYYVDMINRFNEKQYLIFIKLLLSSDIRSKLQYIECGRIYKSIAGEFCNKAVNVHLKNALEQIANSHENSLSSLHLDTNLNNLVKKIILKI